MTRTNQNGDPVVEDLLFPGCWQTVTLDDLQSAISLLCERLNVEIVRTNATKHGNVEVVLREVEND